MTLGLLTTASGKSQAQNADKSEVKIIKLQVTEFVNDQFKVFVTGTLTLGKNDQYFARAFVATHGKDIYPVIIITSPDPEPGFTKEFKIAFFVPVGNGQFKVTMQYLPPKG